MLTDKILNKLRYLINFLKIGIAKKKTILVDYSGQQASDLILNKLNSNEPCMIARFGSGELSYVVEYCNSKLGFVKYKRYIFGEINSYKFSKNTLHTAFNNAGIFPSNESILVEFSKMMLEDMKQLDVIGSWLEDEYFFSNELKNVSKVRLLDLEPYYHEKPWTVALTGKKVLVIHPFAETIKEQYTKSELLFENKDILPVFELITIKAVQSIAGQKTEFEDWFKALEHMKQQINSIDFDIAIIGCGAYGFPLAAHVKRIGKKSIHLGGATQILFGIKGKRWFEEEYISQLFNSNWVFPRANEIPENFKNVENGCYW